MKRNRGITLLECLVASLVLAVLLATAIPLVGRWIDKAQMAYPDAGKTHGDIGAKATETADGDKASVQFFLDLFPMALAKGK